MNYFGVFVSRMPSESVSGELVWAFLVNQLINQVIIIINNKINTIFDWKTQESSTQKRYGGKGLQRSFTILCLMSHKQALII